MSDFTKLNEWKENNPERVRASARRRLKKWRASNPEKVAKQIERSLEHKKDYYRENKDKIKSNRLKRNYGITLEDYNVMLSSQEGKCSICRTEKCVTGNSLAVDHDHGTGKVRGILCTRCNNGIGSFLHDVKLLENAIEYLKRTK